MIAITASEGSARPTLDTLMARNEPRCRWPSHAPRGIAMAREIATATTDSTMCSHVLSVSSDRWSAMNWKDLAKSLMPGTTG